MDKPQLSTEDAEASEKLVDGDKIEIRPQSATPQNGDTRVDMVEVREAFVGMGKEELMKFANDPFWVKLRWFLFGLFWVLWFGMLFGAVAIIAYAPKCSAPAEREWFEKSPLYYINADDIRDSEGKEIQLAKGLSLMKDHLTGLGIKSVLLDLSSQNSDDFKTLPEKFGSEDALKKTLKDLVESDIHTFLKIVPNHASINHEWFNKSANKEEPYSSYFVWSKGKNGGPPSNWNTFGGEPAWTLNSERQEYYLHQDNSSFADFNFRNQELVDYFSDVFKYWLDFGFCGVHLEKVAFLVESESLDDELPSPLNSGDVGEYSFLTHSKTANLDESYAIIKNWGSVIANSSGVLSIDEVTDPTAVSARLIHRPFVLRKLAEPLQDQLKSYIQNLITKPHTTWLLDPVSTKSISIPGTVGINVLFMLLPDTSLVTSGLEIGQPRDKIIQLPILSGAANSSSGDQNSQRHLLKTFKKVIELRDSPSITYGTTKFLANSTVLLVTRLKQGNPGYLIALNLEASAQAVNLTDAHSQGVGENLRLVAYSESFVTLNPEVVASDMISSPEITMPSSSFAVMEFIVASS